MTAGAIRAEIETFEEAATVVPAPRRSLAFRNGAWVVALLLALPVLVVSVLVVSGASANAADDPLDDYRLAVGFYNKDQWKLATESFASFLKKNGQHPKAEVARYFLALSLIKLDDYKQARDVLRAYAKDFPKGRDVQSAGYWIGHCSFYLEDFAASERELAAFLAKSPDDPLRQWALPYLGDVELRLKKPEAAMRHFEESLKAFPESELAEDARFGLARSHELLKQPDAALTAYQALAANRTGQRAAEAQLSVGTLQYDASRFQEAAAAYEALEKHFPNSPQAPLAQLNQGFARYQLGQYPQAIAQFEKAARNEKYAAEATLWKGFCLKSSGDLPQAVGILKAGYEKYSEQPVADKLLFQWAECEQRRGAADEARALFLKVVNRWPKGSLADESLHAACLAAVNAQNLPEADKLLTRFDGEYPNTKLRLRQEILKGRVLAAKNDLPGAEKTLRRVVDATEFEGTRMQARYYLTDVLERRQQHAAALEVSAPLAALWDAGSGPAELAGVFVLRGASQLALARAAAAQEKPGETSTERMTHCTAAAEAAASYLKLSGQGPLAAQARGIQTIALTLAGNKAAAQDLLAGLRKQHAGAPELDQTVYEVGTIAYARQDWVWAESLFHELAARPGSTRLHPRALADLGWTQYKQKKYPESSVTFARLVAEHPQDDLTGEAAFMRGQALQDGGRIPEAQAAFAEAFERPELSDHVFLAGLQAAGLLVRQQKLTQADATYETLLKRFGKRPDADKVLDQWATAHYNAEHFARADELFRRLATEFPRSELADNARLSLAESDLVAGKLDEARRQFQALSDDSTAEDAVRQRSLFQWMQIEFESKRWDELRKVCDASLAKFPQGTYRFDAQWKRAEADFESAAYPAALEQLLKLKGLRNDEALSRAGWLPQVWVRLAETQFRLKDHAAVAATVAEFCEADPQSPLRYLADEVLGRSLKAQGKWPEAREAFERVIKDPHGKSTETAAKSQFMIAETWHHQKNFEAALKEYLKVDILYKFPALQAPALYEAGVCQEALGQWKDAAKTYDELLKNYAANDEIARLARDGRDRVRKRLTAG
ncbi:MAG: tetratricopeptide repeat protein [Planctomycetaceae bacterium]|nr:tetratricopeptide repeat protein [Planctomycetaceae bacterium]